MQCDILLGNSGHGTLKIEKPERGSSFEARRKALSFLRLGLLSAALSSAWSADVVAEPNRCEPVASYSNIFERAAPAIVSVQRTLRPKAARGEDLDPHEEAMKYSGSGVIMDASGLVVTSNHGVEGRGPIRVALNDGREFGAEVVLIDHRTDLAVLRLQAAQDLAVVQLANSDSVRPGDFTLAIGNPLEVGQTITHGIVSAVGRTQIQLNSYEYYIQTDTPLNPGSSGGALLDTTGRLIGVTVAIATETRGWQGIGFAVPANMVAFVLTSARNGDKVVRRPWLGAKLKPVVAANTARFGLKLPVGAVVERVLSDSPAADAGLRADDVIVSVDGEPIRDPNSFDYRFTLKGITGSTRLGLIRDGTATSLNVQLKGAPDIASREIAVIGGSSPLKGATLATLTPAIAEELGVDAYAEGVAVVEVAANTPAEKYDFQRGDILRSANGKPIKRATDVEQMLRNTRAITVDIDRDGDTLLKQMIRTKSSW